MNQFIKRYTFPPKEFFAFKEHLIEEMMKVKSEHDCSFANMKFSDYKLPWKEGINYRPPYWDEAIKLIQPALTNYANQWQCSRIKVESMWFAEYNKGNNFEWHTHEGTNLSAVLHVHGLPENSTQLMGFVDMVLHIGDLVVFPSMLPHRGPNCQGHKIVIGFNLNMSGSLLHNE